MARLVREGSLTRVLPGTYLRTADAERPAALARALHACDSTAVLTGRSAAALHLTRGRWSLPLECTSSRQWSADLPWLRPTRGTIPPELVICHPVPHVDVPTAALQIATLEGPTIIDRALKKRMVTPESLERAVLALAHTQGNAERRRIVAGSVQRPWCPGEREFHALLRRARIDGWVGNRQVVAQGTCYVIDVAFDELRFGIEVDDWETHSGPGAFVDDRVRHNELTAAGWMLLHLTEGMVLGRPERTIHWVRQGLAEARRVRGL
ncbi:hypothetical protein GCM10028815_08560 [Mariniluteicoccus flavus]